MEDLGVNLPTLIAQIVNFGILFGLLYVVAYKPIMRMLDERSKRIKESVEQSESVKKHAENAEEEIRKQIEETVKTFEAMKDFRIDTPFDYVFGTKHDRIEEQRTEFLANNNREFSNE